MFLRYNTEGCLFKLKGKFFLGVPILFPLLNEIYFDCFQELENDFFSKQLYEKIRMLVVETRKTAMSIKSTISLFSRNI
jgi:hypothetical protein